MQLYVGQGKKLKVNLYGQIYKIMDHVSDMAKAYAASIKAGSKTIDDVPESLRALVAELLA